MIIPVKCFTCGKVLGNKYRYYQREVQKRKIDKSLEIDKVVYLTKNFMDKTSSLETKVKTLNTKPVAAKSLSQKTSLKMNLGNCNQAVPSVK